ncbi:MAG: peptidoglycan DD-metalloendopeptidase family protein [Hyphomicrobiales bacterium]
MRTCLALFWLLLSLLSGATLAHAEEGNPASDLQAVESDLAASTARQVDMAKALTAALAAQEETSSALVELSARATQQEKAVASANNKLTRLERDNAKALLALAEKREGLSRLLAGLQRMETDPPPPLAVSPQDSLTALRSGLTLSQVVPSLERQTGELRDALKDVEALRLALATQKHEAAAALDSLNETRRQMAALLDTRTAAADAAASALGEEKDRSQTLANKARSLKDLLAQIESDKAAEAARRAAEAEAAEQARLAAANARPPVVLAESKGLLAYPAEGSILRDYPATKGGEEAPPATPGVFLATTGKAQVLAPADAKVEFAGEFHNFGTLVILDAGQGYLILLAGLGETAVQQGQSVKAGEPVGFMGENPGNMLLADDLKADGHPVLYVEFRHGNVAVDPSPWWKDRRKEAMR